MFIWSAQKYYLKKENDFFIIYSPVKYFKSLSLCNKTFIDGYLLNKQHFHAITPSAVSLILWQNIDKQQENFELKGYNIDKDGKLKFIKQIKIKKVYKTPSLLFDKRKFNNDIIVNNIRYNSNIIGYINISGFMIGQNTFGLYRSFYKGHGSCFYLRSDNYITKLPLFCAKLYPQENWYERDVYFTTADKGEEYLKDKDLLKSCLIYTCLCRQNKCLSFDGSDGRFYRNELCFCQNTIADNDLKNFTLNDIEKQLFKIWDDILKEAKQTKNYKSNYTYGLYQIDVELNTCYKMDVKGNKVFPNDKNYSNKKNSCVCYDYVSLNTAIVLLKEKLKTYYKNYIQDKLFEYELLK